MKLPTSATLAIATLLISATAAQSQGRPDTRYMSCAQASYLVQSRGAIVMSTSNFKYRKYVKNHAYCNINESLKNAYVPTADTRRCKIGFTCFDKSLLFDN